MSPAAVICPKCQRGLLADDFAKDSTKSSGRQSHCKECKRANNAKWFQTNKANKAEATRKYRAGNPTKREAHQQVELALRRKAIARPGRCDDCRKKCRPDGHHDDYSKPLQVRWLCRVCHRAAHKKLDEINQQPMEALAVQS